MLKKTSFYRLFLDKRSLRTTIIVPIVLVSIIALLVSARISYISTSKLTSDYFDSQSLLIGQSISSQMDDFLSRATRILEINKDLVESGMLNTADTETMGAQFISQLKATPYMTYISMGFTDGSYIGAGRLVKSGETNLYRAGKDTKFTFNRYLVEDNKRVEPPIEVGEKYDATQRIWYKTAMENQEIQWYPVYKYINQDALGMGISTKVYHDKSGELLGVLTADLALTRIDSFLKDVASNSSDVFFVMDTNGNIVATNLVQGSYQKDTDTLTRYTLKDYPDKRFQEISKLLSHEPKSKGGIHITVDGKEYHYFALEYKDTYGLEMTIGVALSAEDYVKVSRDEFFLRVINTSVYLITLGLLMVVLIEWLIMVPLKKFTKAHKYVSEGDYQTRITLEGSRELRQLEKGFNETIQALENADAMRRAYMAHEKLATLGGLVSGVTHEVNTPLGLAITMSSYIEKIYLETSELILRGQLSKSDFETQSEELKEYFGILQTNLHRAAELINSFKSVAAGQSHENIVNFNANQLLSQVLASLKHIYAKQTHRIEIQCEVDLMIFSYPGALIQIFTNLIMNSIVHGFKGIENGKISISVKKIEEWITIEYRDDGLGMSKEVLDKLYTPFFTTNLENGGTGIGMNIVENIVTEQLNGKILVESSLGNGVYFKIEFKEMNLS